MGVVLLTIPYTGTHFVQDLFIRQGYTACGMHDSPRDDKPLYTGHMLNEKMIETALDLAKTRPLVTTFRHPFRVEEAHRRIGNTCNSHKALRNFFSRIWPLNPYLVPVDSPRRGEYLEKLRDGLGIDFTTNWKPISSKAQTWDMDLSDFRPSETVKQLCVEQYQFLKQLYDL